MIPTVSNAFGRNTQIVGARRPVRGEQRGLTYARQMEKFSAQIYGDELDEGGGIFLVKSVSNLTEFLAL